MTAGRPRVLVLSLSKVASDARVLKQIARLSETADVVSCGYGPAPASSVAHVELAEAEPRWAVLLRALLIRAHLYRSAYWTTPAVHRARRLLRRQSFDAVLANDLDTVGLALALTAPERIHLDLHEYWLGLHDNSAAWRKLRQPYYRWQLQRWAAQIPSATTVSRTIADRYRDEFGIDGGVVLNATRLHDLAPTPVSRPLRLVHSGGSQPSRRIENMMRAVAQSTSGATLDLYLVGQGTDYYRSLTALADELGDRIRILPPVPSAELIETLNDYDVGIHVLPPTNTNNELALPNKFFDYVQARLALVIGPTPSMVEILRHHDLGIVTADFEPASLTAALDALTPEEVEGFKARSHASAAELSAEPQNDIWHRAIQAIVPQD
ncbi:glycosyltransferase [Microbacterium paraoxydans]|jgi:glycosyltransferase involved in cell wall biosynthesis|uniref:glycosyltransferase n=1 Tax=Microbacterium TaxID=33882 RepID=UPI000D0156DE|nr:glycosyltransferase [Microbacterium sp. str. 'China']AVL96690.1 glycosyltransferase [Microbacterium sp. str. 'China']